MTEKKASENQIAQGIINYSVVLCILVKLDSSNWGSWSLFVRKGLTSVGKEDHLTTRPADPISREWLIDDSGIQMALWNAMEPQILTITQNFPTVKDMWEHLSSSFSDKESLSHAYSVVQSYIRAEQGDSSFTDYFTPFSTIQDELRSMFPPTTDLKVQEERNAKMDVMTFIAGISPKYSSARPLLLSNPAATTSIASMYHLLREMYGPNETRPSTDTSAMHTSTGKGIGRGSHQTHKRGIGRGGGLICHYCKEPGHTKWDCPNRPPGSQPPPRPKARIATTGEASDPNATPAYTFSEEDYCRLQHLLASQTTPPAPSAKAANSSTFPSLSSSWVIDSGATHHMTGNSGILSNLHNVSHQPVRLADGSSCPVLGFGSINNSTNLNLSSVVFWGDAFLTASYLINRMPTPVLHGKTPFSILFPNGTPFPLEPKVFGCVAYVHDHCPKVTKLDPRAIRCVFVGYSRVQKGYRYYSPSLHQYFTCADVTFDESCPYFLTQPTPVAEPFPDPDLPTSTLIPTFHMPSVSSDPPVSTASDSPTIDPPTGSPPLLFTYSRRRQNQTLDSPDSQPSSTSLPSGPTVPLPTPPAPTIPEPTTTTTSHYDPPGAPFPDIPIALCKEPRHCTRYPIQDYVGYSHLSPEAHAYSTTLDSYPIPKNVTTALAHPGWR
ncbi:uncharacterized protein LOC143598514 [Bidens hawaiensis]|uniref:uncharacterized protein LOC143598514 n=1 Tax=Bidens hawaiensis TaxID=980011 RepID=UPI00404A1C7B